MIVPPAVQLRFDQERPNLESLRAIVDGTIRPWASDRGYEYHSRTKSLESVAEKIETGRYARWRDVEDLVAAAVVVPTHSHGPAVASFLTAAFEVRTIRERGSTRKPPEAFRFDSTRWIGHLRATPGLDRAPATQSTLFEVQIRSAFEHAWSVTTHDLAYKGDRISWSRSRLVAQIKAAVEQIDMLIDGFEESADLVPASPWAELERRARLGECFEQKIASGQIASELRPKDWVRFADNVHSLIRASVPTNVGLGEHFARCMEVFERYTDTPPLSSSLFQTSMGVLAEHGLLTTLNDKYVPLITNEVEDIFPALKAVSNRFDF